MCLLFVVFVASVGSVASVSVSVSVGEWVSERRVANMVVFLSLELVFTRESA